MPTRRELLLSAAGLPLLACAGRAADAPKLAVVAFREEVTCPVGHPLMGGGIAPAKETVDPLFVHGFVLTGVGKPVVFAAVDWCELRNGAYDRWRAALAEAAGTDPVRVMLCCLHQHDTPIADLEAEELLRTNKCAGSICDLDFHEKTVRRVAAAVKKATAGKLTPVTHVGTGSATVADVASNRRYTGEGGKVRYDRMSASRDPKIRAAEVGTIDPLLRTLSLWNGDTPLLAVHGYATHPMSFYGKGGVSADFVGMARKAMQAATPDVPQMYVSGCSGNVTAGKYNDGAADNRPVLADRIHKAMAAAWKGTKRVAITEAAFRSETIKLVARSLAEFTEAALTKRLTADPKPFGQCLAALGLSWRKRVAAGVPVDLPVMDFGTAALTILPAEAYVEFQLFAQEQRKDKFVLVAGYGECGPGYIPTERSWTEGDGNLSDWCWVDPGSEKVMKDAIRKALAAK
jgi:hypothetical protein